MLGCLFTIALLAAIIFRCVLIARHTQQKMDMYICVGVAAMLIFQVICNIGHVPVCNARHRPDPSVRQLRRHLHRHAVCCHGNGLRHTEAHPTRVAAVRIK